MTSQILIFILATLTLLTLSRLALMTWQRRRVSAGQAWLPVLLGGLRIDANLTAMFAGLPLLLAPWVGHLPLAQTLTGLWLQGAWLLIVLLELSTPQFIDEYDIRPNRLYIAYLDHPREVFTMLWRGYKIVLLLAGLGMLGFGALGHTLFAAPWFVLPDAALWLKPLLSLLAALAAFLAIRGTLKHRPINPSTVACCGDALVNSLALNSLYSVFYAAYCLKNERSAADAYGRMEPELILAQVNQSAGLPPPADNAPIPSLHLQQATPAPKPRHLVIFVEESLGAQFTGHLGGAGLTPCLDALAAQAWHFTRAYATGTRSVRGLEALVAGFPPSLSEAVLRLPDAQSRFFTLAQLLRGQGYQNHFVYGGEAHFDNMQGFFLGNGFEVLHDRKTFDSPTFVGTWGVSDEDMMQRVHHLLETATQPLFILAFSVSNHSPWEYPQGRIQPEGNPASVENTVRYADWALGDFFQRAQTSNYWDNSVFLIAADHDARVGGCERVPLKHFHIPAMLLGAGITPRKDERLISQIDLPVTLLSLLGISGEHPMIGHDLTRPESGGRALMQYGEAYGYLKQDILTVFEPQRPVCQLRYQAPEHYEELTPDDALVHEAWAHALWPDLVYRRHAYTLPSLLVNRAVT